MKANIIPPTQLEFIVQGKIEYQDDGKWLHPLFALEEFLDQHSFDRSGALLRDSIMGKAAASLVIRLGIKSCEIDRVSKLALAQLDKHGVQYKYCTLVDRINCQTEELLADLWDIEEIYTIIKKRRDNARAKALGLP